MIKIRNVDFNNSTFEMKNYLLKEPEIQTTSSLDNKNLGLNQKTNSLHNLEKKDTVRFGWNYLINTLYKIKSSVLQSIKLETSTHFLLGTFTINTFGHHHLILVNPNANEKDENKKLEQLRTDLKAARSIYSFLDLKLDSQNLLHRPVEEVYILISTTHTLYWNILINNISTEYLKLIGYSKEILDKSIKNDEKSIVPLASPTAVVFLPNQASQIDKELTEKFIEQVIYVYHLQISSWDDKNVFYTLIDDSLWGLNEENKGDGKIIFKKIKENREYVEVDAKITTENKIKSFLTEFDVKCAVNKDVLLSNIEILKKTKWKDLYTNTINKIENSIKFTDAINNTNINIKNNN